MNPTVSERIVVDRDDDGDIDIWADRVGRIDSGPPALLLSAAEEPASRWPAELLSGLQTFCGAAIRFDTRGVGRNRSADPGYQLGDLTADAVAVLDHFGVERAHVIGRSMGGMIGQLLALDHPERVATLTLMSSSAGPDDRCGPPAEWFVDAMSKRLLEGAPNDAIGRVEWVVEQLRWFAGPRFEFDVESAERLVVAEVAAHWHDRVGHGLAVVEAPPRYDRLSDIESPTLIVHGTSDPVYPVGHGQALAEGIDGAEVLLVEGLGHEFPPAFVPQFLDRWSAFVA